MGLSFSGDRRIAKLPPSDVGAVLYDVVCKRCWAILREWDRLPDRLKPERVATLAHADADDTGRYELAERPKDAIERFHGACETCGAVDPTAEYGPTSRAEALARVDRWSANLASLAIAHDADELHAALEEAKRDEREDADPGDDRECLRVATRDAILAVRDP